MEEAIKKKLNFKEEQKLFIAATPKELKPELKWFEELGASELPENIELALVFVQEQKELDQWIDKLAP